MEKSCERCLKEAEQHMAEQQEIVLKNQTDLKIALDTYHDEKKTLYEEFDKFCLQKFGTLIPDLERQAELVVNICVFSRVIS